MLVLTGGDASVALDATVGVAEKFHPSHCRASLRGLDLAKRGFGFLHAGGGVEPVGGDRVHAFAEHDGIRALRILHALINALEPAREVEGHQVTPLPTRSVTSAFMRQTLPLVISGPQTRTQPPSLMPRSAASAGLISMNMSCCSSASHLLDRVSSPPPSYSTSRPEVLIKGNCLAMPFSTAVFCTSNPTFGTRNSVAFARVGYFATRSGRGV